MSLIAAGLMKLSDDQQKFIEFVEGPYFPWYSNVCVTKDIFHGHALMRRNTEDSPNAGVVISDFYEPAISIFKDFCLGMGIEYKTIFRAALNSSSYHTSEMAEIHVDHKFEHKNFIFYINDVSKGSTFIYSEDLTKLEDVIVPKKNKAVIWDGRPHAQGWCAPDERRLVLVVTFI